MEQQVRFLKASDGVRLAYATAGTGTPLVKAPNWLTHLELDWHSPIWRHWNEFLSTHHQLVRYDARGCGLTDWDCEDLSLDRQVADLEEVVDTLGLKRFSLIGISQGGAPAIEYAVRHPERVDRIIIFGSTVWGWRRRSDESARAGQALVEMVRYHWQRANPASRKMFVELFVPDASEEQTNGFAELLSRTTRPEIGARIMEVYGDIDLRDRLPLVRAPTMVMHVRNDAAQPFGAGRAIAAGIPNARFVELEGRNHILMPNEPAWGRFRTLVSEFLGDPVPGTDAPQAIARGRGKLPELTQRELEILTLVARGASNAQIAADLVISDKTVRNHLTNIFQKLGVSSRAQAIVFARDHGVPGLRH